jgi:hypothetical protein
MLRHRGWSAGKRALQASFPRKTKITSHLLFGQWMLKVSVNIFFIGNDVYIDFLIDTKRKVKLLLPVTTQHFWG